MRAASLAPARSELRLIRSWAQRELHATYRQSSLRLVWSVVQPLSVFAVYVVVFHWILDVNGADGLPYLSFMVVGVTVWRYFSIGMMRCTSLVDNARVLGRVYFRREVIPLSGCLTGGIDLTIGTVAMIALAWIQGIAPTVTLLALPVIYLILVLYTGAVAVFLSTVTVFVRDLGHAMGTIAQLLFLATPIMYPPSQLPPELQFLQTANPLSALVESARDVTLLGQWPDPYAMAVHLVVGASLLAASIWYLRAIEHRIVDIA